MVDDELFQLQREVLKHASLDSRHAFMTCRRSYFRKPELVVLSSGTYVSGMTTCKCGYCVHHVKRYLYEQRKRIAKVEKFIQKEGLHPTMMTLVIPHKVTDRLKPLRLKLHQAVSKLLATSGKNQNKLMKKINQRVGNIGYVLRNEINYNEGNGWNTHCHILNLNRQLYSEEEKIQIADEFARTLKDSGFYFSRLDEYKIEKKGGLVHFSDDFANIGYLAKFDSDNPVFLAKTNPSKYKEFAQSFNMREKIPLIKFKGYLMSKINKSLNLLEEKPEEELERIEIPDFLIHHPKEEIEQWLIGSCS